MRPILISLLSLLMTQAPQMLLAAQSPQIDPNFAYRLTNDYASGRSLTQTKQGNQYFVIMDNTRDATEQYWKLAPVGNGKYRLTNLAVGEGKSLDTLKSGTRYLLTMSDTGNSAGQMWNIIPMNNGKYRLADDDPGALKSLDLFNNGTQYVPVMGDLGYSAGGQVWTLTKLPVAAPSALTTTTATTNITITAPLVITQPASPKPLTVTGGLSWNANMIPHGGGTMLCSRTNLFNLTQCGVTKADWVGSHTLSTTCDKGFYDLIWGGTCWDLPPDDGRGKWIRSADPVTSDTAVWRAPRPLVASAQRVKNTAWAWECPSGTFWDIYDGGACWKCPDATPRRSVGPVGANNACETSLNETASAVFLKYNGCPKPDAASMGLKGKRQPGKPFLQVASGCYACPNADEDGNILVTERNANLIAGDAYANNQGCTIVFKWKPPEFPEPGLSGLAGVKEVLLENMLFQDPDFVTTYLTKVAEGLGHKPGTPESIKYVSQQWQEIAAGPYKSAAMANLVFGTLELAAATDSGARTPAEQTLVSAVQDYVQLRRTFIAEQALAMYDAWKANDDRTKNQRARSRLEVIGFDYGTVPLDFQATAMAGFGLGVAGTGAIAAIAGANLHAVSTAKTAREAAVGVKGFKTALEQARAARNATEVARLELYINRALSTAAKAQRVANVFEAFRALSMVSRLAINGPAIIIELAGAILTEIAVEQFMAIMEARSKLEAAVDKAKQPVDLKTMLAEPNGNDKLVYFWSKAMDAKVIQEDPEIVAKVRAAMEVARQRGFQPGTGQ